MTEKDQYPSHTSILFLLPFTLMYSLAINITVSSYHYICISISLTLSDLLLIIYCNSIYHITVA